MNRIFLAALIASGLAFGCDDQDDSTQGSNGLTGKPPAESIGIDACAAVRCAKGPCVVKDGKPVCTEAMGPVAVGDACTGVTCPNQGSCHVEAGKPVCLDACSAVRCANGPCVVKDGKAVCTEKPPTTDICAGVVCPNEGKCHVEAGKPFCVDACAAVDCVNGPCMVVNGKPVCMGSRPDAGAPDASPPSNGSSCKADGDCGTYVDFCAATCGVCRAISKSARPATCQPPANVECLNACEGKRAICSGGACVLR